MKINGTQNIIKSSIFRLFMIIAACIYVAYVSIEIYKATISRSIVGPQITEAEFMQLHSLTNYSLIFEYGLFFLAVASLVVLFFIKSGSFKKRFMASLLVVFIVLWILGAILSWIFNAPVGNLTQPLLFPVAVTVCYFVVKGFRSLRNLYPKF
ncbi:hypothetical protein [Ornithinibacillus contaminans]|uniref:hypothetical protein n=1 Tax=Ornithinibacillus contaminans TaxID=694055 RepID=UPI00064DE2F9|nr:hypothetical protein [Ornithinibacillus contaminans]